MGIHLGGVGPIQLYVVSRWDQTNDIHLNGLST